MQGGDISNALSPRVYVVFEGTLVQESERKGLSRLRPSRMSDLTVEPYLQQRMWDAWLRYGVRFDAVTFRYDADTAQRYCDEVPLPVTNVWLFKDQTLFIKSLPSMPWVTHVIDHQRPLAYGHLSATLAQVVR